MLKKENKVQRQEEKNTIRVSASNQCTKANKNVTWDTTHCHPSMVASGGRFWWLWSMAMVVYGGDNGI